MHKKVFIPITCNNCGKIISRDAREIRGAIKRGYKNYFCNNFCFISRKSNSIEVKCAHCDKKFTKIPSQVKKTKNHFCSHSCNASYQNTHKTKGTRRSKLELFLESQLSLLYPNLNILYNEKSTINSELDIFIPSLNLAFELNGIFHYEPIYGQDKLSSIQNNDSRKIQACLEKNIELCIIDVSILKYFKPANAQKYLNIVVSIINKKI